MIYTYYINGINLIEYGVQLNLAQLHNSQVIFQGVLMERILMETQEYAFMKNPTLVKSVSSSRPLDY